MTGRMAAPEVPQPDRITAPWWEATREHRLVVQVCEVCGHAQHPPRGLCIGCGSTEHLGWRESTGRGVVDSFTVVHRTPRPELEVPYVIARVRLEEGVVLLSRLEGQDPQSWRIEDRVKVEWVDLADGRALPVFVPAA